jgi:nitrite reductase/ring-hydroxylating ferredoxin subunit
LKTFFPITLVSNLIPGRGFKAHIKGKKIALFKHRSKIYAIQNGCPHQNADLADGYIKDDKVHCKLHHWAFDLSSGTYSFNPKMKLLTYEVRVRDDMIYIGIDSV